jgi:hypothetical protein
LAIYTQGVPVADGWNVRNGKLTTTQGTSYVNDTTSDAVLFLDLTGRTAATLSLQATVDTEQDYDYFSVYAVVGGVRKPLAQLTGPLGAQNLSFDLAPYLGGPVQLDFEFTSDEAVSYSGVFIDRISVQ